MKNLLIIALLLIYTGFGFAQNSGKGFNFQGYARNADGAPLASQTVNVKFSIYPEGNSGSTAFAETQNIDTDAYGVFQAVIGSVETAAFQNLKFNSIDYWLKVEVKTASSNFVVINETRLLSVPYAKAADNGVPVGTILPFAGPKENIPFGYLACDGKQYSTTTYAALYAALGNSWGGSGSAFNVPDFRGMFMRGVDDGAGNDPNAAARTAQASGGNNGDKVGSVQNDEIKSHNHDFKAQTSTAGNHSHTYSQPNSYIGYLAGVNYGGAEGERSFRWGLTDDGRATSTAGNHSHNVEGTTDGRGGNETRPKNAAVWYIIKY